MNRSKRTRSESEVGSGILRIALFLEMTHGFNERVLHGILADTKPDRSWIFHHFQPVADTLDALAEWKPDGIITAVPSRSIGLALESLAVPVVNVSNVQAAPGIPFVANDNAAVGIMGAQHFIARGFRRCAFIGWPFQLYASERERAFVQTLAAAGISCSCYKPGPSLDRVGWYRHRRAADSHLISWLGSLATPLGLMVANDQLAWRITELCRLSGLRIPQDIAVLGVDDDRTICQLTQPRLSSIQVDAERIGVEAAAMLDRLMRGDRSFTRLSIPPRRIQFRQSTESMVVDDPLVQQALDLIARQAHLRLGVPSIAAQIGVSRRTLERRFLTTLQRSILAEILRVRIERAKDHLVTTGEPLARIAAHAGFASAVQLTRAFARLVGMSPRDYRRHALSEMTHPS